MEVLNAGWRELRSDVLSAKQFPPHAGQVSLDVALLHPTTLISIEYTIFYSEAEQECHWLKMEKTTLDVSPTPLRTSFETYIW